MVFDAVTALEAAGRAAFRPGDVTARLRANGTPFGAWEVRGELTNLARLGLVAVDAEMAAWRLVAGASFSIDAANAARERASRPSRADGPANGGAHSGPDGAGGQASKHQLR